MTALHHLQDKSSILNINDPQIITVSAVVMRKFYVSILYDKFIAHMDQYLTYSVHKCINCIDILC